jgi:hypothetical protein
VVAANFFWRKKKKKQLQSKPSHQSQKHWETEQCFFNDCDDGQPLIIAFEQKRERRDEARTTSEP